MNLTKLFEAQRVLDEHIIKEKGLEGQDLLPNLVLALHVEFGELANEHRGFKHWSNDRKPRTEVEYGSCPQCNGIGESFGEDCQQCGGKGEIVRNHVLEEFADCLAFILSIGNHISYNDVVLKEKYWDTQREVTEIFSHLIHDTFHLGHEQQMSKMEFEYFIVGFLELGYMLGFTSDQIETAYFEKNTVNHQRQESGY